MLNTPLTPARPHCLAREAGVLFAGLMVWVIVCCGTWRGEAQEYLVHNWDLDEGLPSTCMNAIIRTPDGYVWLGTQQGLVRFDGVRFVTFNAENTPALMDNRITALTTDGTNGFWLGTAGGKLARWSGGVMTAVDLGDATREKSIHSLTMDGGGNLWLGTSAGGLLRLKDGRITAFTTTNGLRTLDVWQVLTDSQDRLWYLVSPGRLGYVEGERCHEVDTRGWPRLSIRCMSRAQDGGLWLATVLRQNTGARIFRFLDGQLTEDTQPYPWLQDSARVRPVTLLEDKLGNLWCGTAGEGVYLRPPHDPWRAMTGDLPASQAEVLCLLEDEGESVWLGTRTSGLHQSVPRPVASVHLPPNHKQNVLLTVCVRRDGSVWGGTDNAGVFRWVGSEVTRLGEEEGLPRTRVNALYEGSRSNLWAATGAGLFRFHDGRFEAMPNAALGGNIMAVYEDRSSNLWAGTPNGLVCVAQAQQTPPDQPPGLPAGQVVAVSQDQAGQFWVVVAGQGVFHEENGAFTKWARADGKPQPWQWKAGSTIRRMLPDADGSMWVGSFGGGLFRLEGGRIKWWSWGIDGLPSNHILDIQEDDAGNLWCSSENGIFGYTKKALLDYNSKSGTPPVPLRLTTAEGLPYKVCSGAGQPASAKSPDGRLWFPDGASVASFVPASVPRNLKIWPTIIEELRVDGTPMSATAGEPIQVKSDVRSFEFVFSSPNILAPNRLRFRHRLDGLDSDWSAEGSQRSVKYGALPPGDYQFRVTTRDSDDFWNEQEAKLPLTVVPRWWQTTTFRIVLPTAILLGIAMIIRQVERNRVRKKLASLERERALEKERARIARDIHDDLGASLTQVALLGEMAGHAADTPEELRNHTRQISDAAHEMVQSLEAIVWAVRPENDTLRSLVEYMNRRTDELFEKMPRQYQFIAPADLPERSVHAEVRHNIFLAYKEGLTNALKHADATEVRIEVTCDKTWCRISVADNGRGFEAGEVRADGTGLKNMQLRLKAIGGSADLTTQPGSGTTVRLEFPLNWKDSR